MSRSHLQTRTLTDALDRADSILGLRRTRLGEVKDRHRLANCFAVRPGPEFQSWAYSASEYDETALAVGKHAPELLSRMQRPISDQDFTIIGHCSLDLRFDTDHNGANSVRHTLRDGAQVAGAQVSSVKAVLYGSGLVSLPTIDSRVVYPRQPTERPATDAAQLASSSLENRGEIVKTGLSVTFPRARRESSRLRMGHSVEKRGRLLRREKPREQRCSHS